MDPLSDAQIRASFVNCSKGEAQRLALPRELDAQPWADLDFLGWRPSGAPDRGYLVARHRGDPVGIALRVPPASRKNLTKYTVCSFCLTAHAASGVSLLTARRAGKAGRDGNSVGAYMCADLACPLYVRGKRRPATTQRYEETLTTEEQVERMLGNVAAFLDQVLETLPAAR